MRAEVTRGEDFGLDRCGSAFAAAAAASAAAAATRTRLESTPTDGKGITRRSYDLRGRWQQELGLARCRFYIFNWFCPVFVENADPAQGILGLIHPRESGGPRGHMKGVSNPESRGAGQGHYFNIII